MRSHGVTSYPDPKSGGALVKETPEQLGIGTSRFDSAASACAHIIPNSGQPTEAGLQQSWSDFRTFARCMRSHGVSHWPDPTSYPRHPERPTFDLASVGIDPNSPRIAPAIRGCAPLLRGTNPQRLGGGGS
jgi:hypothetical protein